MLSTYFFLQLGFGAVLAYGLFDIVRHLSTKEIIRFSSLGLAFIPLIGGYWTLRVLKDTILLGTVGFKMQPTAKMLSVFVVIALVALMAKLVDLVNKQTLFYILCPAFAFLFLGIAYFTAHPTIGLANTIIDRWRLLGYVAYCSVEAFGSIMIALFWAFASSIISAESAKRGYALTFVLGQIGAIAGTFIIMRYSPTVGIAPLFAAGALGVLLVPLIIFLFTRFASVDENVKVEKAKPSTGIFEGLRLIATKPYLLGIVGISTIYEIVGTILEFVMKNIAAKGASNEAFAAFTGQYGMIVNITSLIILLTGTSTLLRKAGLTFCLLAFPATVAAFVGVLLIAGNTSSLGIEATLFGMPAILMIAMVAAVSLKALSYALNNPAKELMYIPTSKDVKFKAKSIIDGFGARTSKGGGALINEAIQKVGTTLSQQITAASVVSFGLIAVWMSAGLYVGRTFKKLNEDGKIIE